jgi:alpha-methylacyl-CoA racemase
VAPVLGLGEAPWHPHLRARATFDRDGVPAPAPRFAGADPVRLGPPPLPGANADSVRADWATPAGAQGTS